MFATFKSFALAVALQVLAFGLPATLGGCAAASAVAASVKPSGFGVRTDPRYGRCYSAGAALAGQVEVTAHLCARFLDGGAPPVTDGVDAGGP